MEEYVHEELFKVNECVYMHEFWELHSYVSISFCIQWGSNGYRAKTLAELNTEEVCQWFSNIGLQKCLPFIRGKVQFAHLFLSYSHPFKCLNLPNIQRETNAQPQTNNCSDYLLHICTFKLLHQFKKHFHASKERKSNIYQLIQHHRDFYHFQLMICKAYLYHIQTNKVLF